MSQDDLSPQLIRVMPKGDAVVTQSAPFIIVYDLPEVCGRVCICRDPPLLPVSFCRLQYVSGWHHCQSQPQQCQRAAGGTIGLCFCN